MSAAMLVLRAEATEYEPTVKKVVSLSLPFLMQYLEKPRDTESPMKTEFSKFGLSTVEPAGVPVVFSTVSIMNFSGGTTSESAEICVVVSVVGGGRVVGGAVKTPVCASSIFRHLYS